MRTSTIRVGIGEGDVVGRTGAELQVAADALAARGGGVLEIGPGVYEMADALRLASHVHVKGAGAETVLRKCDGAECGFIVDADYGQLKLSPERPELFRAGMAVHVWDDASQHWFTSTSRVLAIEGGVLHIADHLANNYRTEKNARVSNATSVVWAAGVEDVVVEDIAVDGNKAANGFINGCRGGGIYLHKAAGCRVSRCTVRDFNGDGMSWQITRDITVEDCTVEGVTGLGFHPGTGSARTTIRGSRSLGNGQDGLFLCWRVQESAVEGCEFAGNGRFGVSIGHKDTDNAFRRNRVAANGRAGVHFRDEKESNAGSRNTFEENVIESNGRAEPSAGVEILGATSGLVFTRNVIRPGEGGGQTRAFAVGPAAAEPELRENDVADHPGART